MRPELEDFCNRVAENVVKLEMLLGEEYEERTCNRVDKPNKDNVEDRVVAALKKEPD